MPALLLNRHTTRMLFVVSLPFACSLACVPDTETGMEADASSGGEQANSNGSGGGAPVSSGGSLTGGLSSGGSSSGSLTGGSSSGGSSTGGTDSASSGGTPSWRDNVYDGIEAMCDTMCAGKEGLECRPDIKREYCVNQCFGTYAGYYEDCPEPMATYLDCIELHPETFDYFCDENMMVQLGDQACTPSGKEVEVCLKELLE